MLYCNNLVLIHQTMQVSAILQSTSYKFTHRKGFNLQTLNSTGNVSELAVKCCLCGDLTILFFVTDGVPRTACGGSPRLGLWNTEMGDGTDEENHV